MGDRPAVGVARRREVAGERAVLDVHDRVLVVVDRAAVAEVVAGAGPLADVTRIISGRAGGVLARAWEDGKAVSDG